MVQLLRLLGRGGLLTSPGAFPPVAEVLPHQGQMRLLACILDHSAAQTVCRVEIGPDSLFVQADGGVPAWVGLEYMAQCVAAHAGLRARARGEPVKVGFLIGCRRLEFLTPGYRVGQSLTAVARHVWGQGELASFACRLEDASSGAMLVEGQLSVVLPDTLDALRQDASERGR